MEKGVCPFNAIIIVVVFAVGRLWGTPTIELSYMAIIAFWIDACRDELASIEYPTKYLIKQSVQYSYHKYKIEIIESFCF